MPMNIDGNFVTRFGDRLPVPYMEKIVIKDQTYEIQISFYIKPPNFEEINSYFYDQYINSLSELKVSIVSVIDGVKTDPTDPLTALTPEIDYERYVKKYGPISHATTGTGLFEKLMDNTISILQIATPTNKTYTTEELETFYNEQVISYDDISFVPPNASTVLYNEPMALSEYIKEDLYDSRGELVHKYTRSIIIEHDSSRLPSEPNTITAFNNKMISGLTTNFVAFTTSVAEYPNYTGFDDIRTQIINREPYAQLLFNQVSDLSYEQISADKAIKGSELTIFKTMSGELYDGNILQAIDSSYYGNVVLTNNDIVNTFSDLIGTTSDGELQQKFDDLAFMLVVHGKKHDILVKLNEFRKTFVETSTATPVGRFHEKLEIRLFNTNNAVKRGIPLQKMFNMSPTVIDGREKITLEYERPEYGEVYDIEKATNYIYTKRAKLGSYALPSGYSWSTEEAQAEADIMSSQLQVASDLVRELEADCTTQFEQIYYKIQAAFREMDAEVKGSQINEGIPELVPSPTRLTYTNYTTSILNNAGYGRFDPISVGASVSPSLPLAVARDETYTGTGGDLDGDGFGSSATATSITVKMWPYDTKWYSNLFHEKGIRIGDFGADRRNITAEDLSENARQQTGRDVPDDDYRLKLYKTLNAASLNWTSQTEKDVAANKGFSLGPIAFLNPTTLGTAVAAELMEEFSTTTDDMSGDKLEYMNAFLLVTESDKDNPNTFVEVATEVMYAEWQSGRGTDVVRTDEDEGKWAGIDWTGSDDDKSIEEVTWDYNMEIRKQIEKFKEAYKLYLDAILEAEFIKEAINLYTQMAALGGVAGVDLIYTKYNIYLSGFVFFDYEKALKRTSVISKVFDVAKVEQLFGRQLTHTYFKVIEASLNKFYDKSVSPASSVVDTVYAQRDTILYLDGVSTRLGADEVLAGSVRDSIDLLGSGIPYETSYVSYDSLYPADPQSLGSIKSYSHAGEADSDTDDRYTSDYYNLAIALPNIQHTELLSRQYGATDISGSRLGTYVEQPSWGTPGPLGSPKEEFTYIIPRSFQFADEDADNDYRLICYEFQDVAGSFTVGAGADGWGQSVADGHDNRGGDYGTDYLFDQNQHGNSYIMSIKVEDRTKDLYANIVRMFTKAYTEYDAYYQALIEECSHNLSDERMNKFFIDGIIDNYSSAPHLAPWYRVPLVYLTHMDLVLNTYGGSYENIKAAAIDLSQKLHPSNITLTEAEAFRDRLISFWETYYQPDTGAVWDTIHEYGYVEEHEFGGMNSTDGYVAIMKELPSPVNLDYLGYSYMTGDVVAVDTDDIDV